MDISVKPISKSNLSVIEHKTAIMNFFKNHKIEDIGDITQSIVKSPFYFKEINKKMDWIKFVFKHRMANEECIILNGNGCKEILDNINESVPEIISLQNNGNKILCKTSFENKFEIEPKDVFYCGIEREKIIQFDTTLLNTFFINWKTINSFSYLYIGQKESRYYLKRACFFAIFGMITK